MRAAIVGASDFNGGHFQACYEKRHSDFVIAADAGYAHLRRLGAAPDAVVGDFDSLGFVPEASDVRRHPAEKDQSDVELACDIALERGCGTLLLYGCLGRRLDHTLANLQLMVGLARRGVRVLAVGDGYAVAALHGWLPGDGTAAVGAPGDGRAFDGNRLEGRAGGVAGGGRDVSRLSFRAIPPTALVDGPYGNYVSLFAFGGMAEDVTLRGLKYPLDGAAVPDDATLCLSNEFTGQEASICVGHGELVVTFPLAAWDYLDEEL